ncbi:hypothetical protein [Bacteroides thetaiotaomicron]|uniref:hypothetical protein n=1 Tax=Bacteroides thetaiotaomicron TaxID=818 RepID=UPI002165848C|nr:hypothetical protein [Bacteroides thetaiotaomicron]MCS2294623.1 hypothetical protein [Bacteroides thetaiotaomicron]
MFDKIIMKATVDTADIDTIVLRNYLEQCTEGDEVYYKSTAYANFDGCFIELRGNKLKCKCSICKLYSKGKNGKLDNSRPMTFAMAVRTIKELLLRLCVRMENAVVTYYEIGITMKMSHSADCYIRQVQEISDRILWNDANFPEYRQKTTEKSKYFRKVLKVYDKSFEAGEKGRKVGDNILRIETVYRHQSVSMLEFTDYFFLSKMGRIFYKDWSEICFVRELSATKGVKISQLEKAREIHRLGVTRYKERYKRMFLDGKLTKKQWETIRNFARVWPAEREKYVEEVGELEKEFKDRLLSNFQIGIFTPVRRKL